MGVRDRQKYGQTDRDTKRLIGYGKKMQDNQMTSMDSQRDRLDRQTPHSCYTCGRSSPGDNGTGQSRDHKPYGRHIHSVRYSPGQTSPQGTLGKTHPKHIKNEKHRGLGDGGGGVGGWGWGGVILVCLLSGY